MTYNKDIVERLSLFNNISLSKRQWEIVLKGCGCPKSTIFWTALRRNNLQRIERLYTLLDINKESFNTVWTYYCELNNSSSKKSYLKKKARQKARQMADNVGVRLYLIHGYLTTEIPERD